MNRRTLLQTIAALPLCGWVRPYRQPRIELTFDDSGFERTKAHMRRMRELLKAIAAKVEGKARALEASK
jgi:hypothetical protein